MEGGRVEIGFRWGLKPESPELIPWMINYHFSEKLKLERKGEFTQGTIILAKERGDYLRLVLYV